MGNCISCQAGEASDSTERKSHPQYTQATSFHLWDDREMVSLDWNMHAQEEHAVMCSASAGQQSHAWLAEGGSQDLLAIKGLECTSPSSYRRSYAIISGSPKFYQLGEDSEDQSTTENMSVAEMLDPPQCPEGGSSLPNTIDIAPPSQSHGGSSSEQGAGSSLLQSQLETESLFTDSEDDNLAALLQFLALKYLREEPTTMAEMQLCIPKQCNNFPVLFREATYSMQLIFGIDVKKAQPSSSYVLVPVLGLTYDGMDSNRKGYPRTILLIIVLGIIFLQGNCAREEAIWEVLEGIGVRAGVEHLIYGEPRKFITEDLVQEQYLSYLVVPSSDPPQYMFLWGPRACAETSKREVLEFLFRLRATTLSIFPVSEEEDSENEN